jgi:hypothetical protein
MSQVLRAGSKTTFEVSNGSRLETDGIHLGSGRRPRTAVAMYQGRMVAANLLGTRRARYVGIPRVVFVFADPEIAAVGRNPEAARRRGSRPRPHPGPDGTLLDHMTQFPTCSEAYLTALESLGR